MSDKVIVKTSGKFSLYDRAGGQTVPRDESVEVKRTAFIDDRIKIGQLEVVEEATGEAGTLEANEDAAKVAEAASRGETATEDANIPDENESVDYSELNVDELKALAEEREVMPADGEGSGKKGAVVRDDIVAALELADEGDAE